MIPESVKQCIETSMGKPVLSSERVSGGSINEAASVEIESHGTCFLKWNRKADPDMFANEVKGLSLLQSADTGLHVPDVILQDTGNDGTGFLLQSFVMQGSPAKKSAVRFGVGLANLHRVSDAQFGLDHDNYIGRLPQSNRRRETWPAFFVEERIEPQLKRAIDAGKFKPSIQHTFRNLYEKLPDLFPDEVPALLHGDLWGGNFFYDAKGNPVIFDPAVYYGHREIELAFTYLFGGFSPPFYDAYKEAYPLEPGFNTRKDIYNIYPLLVHTNLFGGHYGRQVESIVRRYE